MEKLLIRNAHRVSEVRREEGSEVLPFGMRAGDRGVMEYYAGEKSIDPVDFGLWEAVSFKYDVTLDEYWDLSRRAYTWTSFDPERRGQRTIAGYEEELNADLENMPEEEKERYISGYKKHFSAWLSAASRCASSAITGGSGFNTRKAERANAGEHNRMGEFIGWRERALKAIAKKREEDKTTEEKQGDEWARLKLSILSSAATIKAINDGTNRCSSKPLFVSSIYNKVDTYAKKGNVEMVDIAVDLIRELNKQTLVMTERHKVFGLPEKAAKIRANMNLGEEKTEDKQSITLRGVVVVNNEEADRIQLIFDEKPSEEIIKAMKKIGMRWSPRFGAWQRQLTVNAVFAVKKMLQEQGLMEKEKYGFI